MRTAHRQFTLEAVRSEHDSHARIEHVTALDSRLPSWLNMGVQAFIDFDATTASFLLELFENCASETDYAQQRVKTMDYLLTVQQIRRNRQGFAKSHSIVPLTLRRPKLFWFRPELDAGSRRCGQSKCHALEHRLMEPVIGGILDQPSLRNRFLDTELRDIPTLFHSYATPRKLGPNGICRPSLL
jgi:hypothetical protein